MSATVDFPISHDFLHCEKPTKEGAARLADTVLVLGDGCWCHVHIVVRGEVHWFAHEDKTQADQDSTKRYLLHTYGTDDLLRFDVTDKKMSGYLVSVYYQQRDPEQDDRAEAHDRSLKSYTELVLFLGMRR